MSNKTYHNPWAGLSSYQDPEGSDVQLKFCGRDNESFDVMRLIDDNIFVTLYGKSGTGKTSLLNAGVFPRLRREQYLPVSIRLGMDAIGMSFQLCILTKLDKALEGKGHKDTIEVVPMPEDEQSPAYLWSYFARTRFVTNDERVLFPVVVFDQFEEVFRHRRQDAEALLRQIYFMMDENRALSNRMVDGRPYQYDFNFRFVASIREDDLYRLEDSIDNSYLSDMKRCRYRLRSLTEQGAKDAILIPGDGLFKAEEQEEIVNTIINIARNKDDGSISTNILSLICSRIFVDYQKSGAEYITPALVDTFVKGNPFERFYNEATRGFSNREKSYIEDHLVDSTGRRNSVPEADFLLHVKNGTVLLDGSQKILQRTSVSSDGGNYRIELIHDSFCEPLVGQKEIRKQKRKIQIFSLGFLVTCLVLGIAWIYLVKLQDANAKMKENAIRFAAEKAISLTDQGDSYSARLLALSLLPENVEKQTYLPEAEAALRYAFFNNSAILKGHTAAVVSTCFSPDGKYILSSSYDKTIILWDANSGIRIRTFKGHKGFLLKAVFSPDGKRIASASYDKTIRIWDIKTGKSLHEYTGHTDNVYSVAFSPDGRNLVSASEDKTIRIWDLKTSECIKILRGHQKMVECAIYSPDGKYIASSSEDATIKIWDAKSGENLRTLTDHTAHVQSIDYSPDGLKLVSASRDSTVKIWDAISGKCIQTLRGHSDVVQYARFNNDGHLIASGADDKDVRLWDVSTGACLDILKGHTVYVTSPHFSPDGKRIVSGSVDYTVRIWDNPALRSNQYFQIDKHDRAFDISISNNGKYVIFSYKDSTCVFDLSRNTRLYKIDDGENILKTSFSKNNRYIACSMRDLSFRVWDFKKKKWIFRKDKQTLIDTAPQFSSDGRTMASITDSAIYIYDVSNFSCIDIIKTNGGNTGLSFSQSGNKILLSSMNGTISVWDRQKRNLISVTKMDNPKHFPLFTPDEKNIIISSGEVIKIINIQSGEILKTFQGHSGGIYDISLSPNGKYLASVSHDCTVKIWDFASGVCLFNKTISQFYNVAFLSNGNKLILNGYYNSIILDFPTLQELINKTRERFKNRKLTPDERRKYYLE